MQGVVPVAVKVMGLQLEHPHLGVADLLAGFVRLGIQDCLHLQSTRCRGRADEIDDGFETEQRPPLPVQANK